MKCIVCGDTHIRGGGTIYGIPYCEQHVNIVHRVANHILGNLLKNEMTQMFSSFPQWNPKWKYGTDEYFTEDEGANTELVQSLEEDNATE